jgi:hypothetical protein
MVIREARQGRLTRGCLISTCVITGSRANALLLISLAMTAGECSGIWYTESGYASFSRVKNAIPRQHTVTLLGLPRAPVLVHVHQRGLLLFNQRVRCTRNSMLIARRRRLGILTSISTHSISSHDNPRRMTDTAHQPVLPVVCPTTFCCSDGVDRRGLVGVC